jgi:hypothetical protein
VINQIEGPIITLRDGRDQLKFPPTCGNPTTFRAKLGERPLQSVMNFGNAAVDRACRLLGGCVALSDGHEYPLPESPVVARIFLE